MIYYHFYKCDGRYRLNDFLGRADPVKPTGNSGYANQAKCAEAPLISRGLMSVCTISSPARKEESV